MLKQEHQALLNFAASSQALGLPDAPRPVDKQLFLKNCIRTSSGSKCRQRIEDTVTVVTAGREGCVGKRDKRTELACPKLRLQMCLPRPDTARDRAVTSLISSHKKSHQHSPSPANNRIPEPPRSSGLHLQQSSSLFSTQEGREAAVPVVRDEELELSDVGGILGEDDVTCELARGKPEREARWLVQLELSVDSAMRKEPSAAVPGGENESRIADDSREKSSPGTTNYEAKLGQRFSSKSFLGHTMKRVKD